MFARCKWGRPKHSVLRDERLARPALSRIARATTVFVSLGVYLVVAGSMSAGPAGCPKRIVHFRITQSDIAQMERSEAQGHQPWRSNPYTVAEVWLWQVESGLNPRTAYSIPYKRTVLSSVHEIFRFELKRRQHTDWISVRRFHWHDPDTAKTYLTVWWATEAVISDCSKPSGKTREHR